MPDTSSAVIFVARSVGLSKWASDVGLGKYVHKVGLTTEPPKAFVAAATWAGFTDWTLLKTAQAPEGTEEAALLDRLAAREKRVDPTIYPKLRGDPGMFRVTLAQVENHMIVARALASATESLDIKVKPVDFAAYLLHLALK